MEMERIEFPAGYSFAKLPAEYCPWHLQKDGKAVVATSTYNKEGWYVCYFNDGDEGHMAQFAAAMNAQAARIERLEKALRDARVAMEGWQSYASDYFKDKHDAADDLAAIDEALAE